MTDIATWAEIEEALKYEVGVTVREADADVDEAEQEDETWQTESWLRREFDGGGPCEWEPGRKKWRLDCTVNYPTEGDELTLTAYFDAVSELRSFFPAMRNWWAWYDEIRDCGCDPESVGHNCGRHVN
jgi:hypothetical protein